MVCFRKKNSEFQEVDLSVSLNGENLKCEKSATFLGITIDEHLSWEEHCNQVANKMARNVGILNKIKNFIPTSSLFILYNSLIFPQFSYGTEVWGACLSKYLKRIIGIQKKAIRNICKSDWTSHTEPRMKSQKVLKVEDQQYLKCMSLAFDMLKGNSPDIYNLVKDQNLNNAQHELRSRTNKPDNLRLPAFSRTQVKSSFLCKTPDLWNALPENIQKSDNRRTFKTKLKKIILDRYDNQIDCKNPQCIDRRFHKK